jgi:hypothetical protein
LQHPRRDTVPQSSPKPTHKKSGSFGKLFGTKEPSLNSFKQLAELQQKELAQKGQKLPFGVPQAKLPSSVKDDYKKAKQRAKERAKLHEVVKEKLKLQEQDDRYTRRPSVDSITADEDHSLAVGSTIQPQHNRKSVVKRFSSLDPLPELPNMDAVLELPRTSALPTTSHASYEYKKPSARVTGVLKGDARKGALPWE